MSDKRIKKQVKTFLRTSNNMFKQVKTLVDGGKEILGILNPARIL